MTTAADPPPATAAAPPAAAPPAAARVIRYRSAFGYAETVQRVEAELAERGIDVFARIDHAANAAATGAALPPTLVIIFGNPRAGTPLMLAAPTLALDLPLRILISQDGQDVVLAHLDSVELVRAYGLPAGRAHPLLAVHAIAAAAAGRAASG